MRKHILIGAFGAAAAMAMAGIGAAADKPAVDSAALDAAMKTGWPRAKDDWAKRLDQDATMKVCSETHNAPSQKQFEEIQARETASVKFPEDGVLMGKWEEGEKIAQSGYGLRFSDYPPRRDNGGNCYACHQLSRKEVSFGTIGPTLYNYGKERGFKPEEVKAVYTKIYNSHAVLPCSNMPRLGSNGVLSIEQIKHLVALLMDPESPVNK
ncbi:MAG: sulfur oxidation c-type cytochrome SoxX [Hyphomicrobiales bacterium]